uniref:UEV domain-containing protein n=1 Tax=Mesocestoides corti TaxID=53468 RepID=A0A5K3FAG3_MESCO
MSTSSSVLHHGLRYYQHTNAARLDIEKASQAYHSLQVKLQHYGKSILVSKFLAFENGQTNQLLCLEGTIPVKYMGNTYNIPLAVYFVHQHPYHPPIAYVRPTSTMQIKAGPNVDTNGKVFLPYLSEWKFPGSSTQQLLGILQEVFGSRPPVFAKPNTTQPAQNSIGFTPYATNTPPNGAGYGVPGAGWGAMPGLPSSTTALTQAAASMPPNSAFNAMPPIPSATTTSPYLAAAAAAAGSTVSSKAALSEEDALISSLRSAVQDKLNREQREVVANLTCEVQSLEATQRDLLTRGDNLDTIRAQMISELEQIKSLTRELEEKTKEYKEVYRKLKQEANGKVDYDSVVDTTTPVYRQLFEAFAEEQAIGDVLYYLSQALENGAIEPDDFLKAVRDQSRNQFVQRATVYQCRARAGLPSV